MMNPKNRLCIYPKDVMIITGKSYCTALRLLKTIKAAYKKPKDSLITYSEFCQYTNLEEEDIIDILK